MTWAVSILELEVVLEAQCVKELESVGAIWWRFSRFVADITMLCNGSYMRKFRLRLHYIRIHFLEIIESKY